MIDVCSDKGFLGPALSSMILLQMVLQGRWHNDNVLLTLPHIEEAHLKNIRYLHFYTTSVNFII